MFNITIVDSIMGSGKTSWAIQYMKNTSNSTSFIFVTPFLTEFDRIKNSVPNCKIFDPENKGNGKLANFKDLVRGGFNIATTHRLFEMADLELIELIANKDYVLIQDEVIEVVSPYELKKHDFDLLYNSQMISVDPNTGAVIWNEKSPYQDTKYNDLKRLSDTKNLIYFENSILFWTFPITAFMAFKEIYILTYLFNGSDQKHYFDMNHVSYNYKAITLLENGLYQLIDYEKKVPYKKEKIKSLINIYHGKLNDIGKEDYTLSKRWYEKDSNRINVEKMQRNLITYFKNNVKTSSQVNMWTCFKDHKTKLKGKGYSKAFVPLNSRATNEYQDRRSLAYVINRYMQPYKLKFFRSKGLQVEEDLMALSELIQWIWRSRIRKGESINLYIPSKRMRSLLENYLNSDL
ncbi:hypothetical protein ACVBAX_06270 [Robertmurraya sp. GLU-23]